MNYIDLFAGAGGMSLGFESAGWKQIFANEYDEDAACTLKENLIEGKVVKAPIEMIVDRAFGRSVKTMHHGRKVITAGVAATALARNRKNADTNAVDDLALLDFTNVDVIVGGPPCQGFSTVGRGKKGTKDQRHNEFLDDPRNQLFRYFLEVVDFVKPRAIVIENVKGLLSSSTYSHEIIDAFENYNYYISEPIKLNSADFGIPQSRERVFFVGFRFDDKTYHSTPRKFNDFLFKLNSLKESRRITLKEAIDDLPNIRSNPKQNNLDPKFELAIPSLIEQKKIKFPSSFGENVSKLNYNKIVDLNNQSNYVKEINSDFIMKRNCDKLFNHKARYQNDRDLAIYKMLKPGKYLTHESNRDALEACPYDVGTFADKYFKLDPDKPSKTVVAHLSNDNNSFVHYGIVPRGITPREAARIQSFPDHYRFYGSQSSQFKQIGNAVPPKLAKKIAEALEFALNKGNNNFD